MKQRDIYNAPNWDIQKKVLRCQKWNFDHKTPQLLLWFVKETIATCPLLFPAAGPGGRWQFPAAESRSLPAQPGAFDSGGWSDECRQDSVMHTAVGSSPTAQAWARSSLECCLSLKSLYALKATVPKILSFCLLATYTIVPVTLTYVFLALWSRLLLISVACNVDE